MDTQKPQPMNALPPRAATDVINGHRRAPAGLSCLTAPDSQRTVLVGLRAWLTNSLRISRVAEEEQSLRRFEDCITMDLPLCFANGYYVIVGCWSNCIKHWYCFSFSKESFRTVSHLTMTAHFYFFTFKVLIKLNYFYLTRIFFSGIVLFFLKYSGRLLRTTLVPICACEVWLNVFVYHELWDCCWNFYDRKREMIGQFEWNGFLFPFCSNCPIKWEWKTVGLGNGTGNGNYYAGMTKNDNEEPITPYLWLTIGYEWNIYNSSYRPILLFTQLLSIAWPIKI